MIEGVLPAPSRKCACAGARLDKFHKICNECMAGETASAWYRVHPMPGSASGCFPLRRDPWPGRVFIHYRSCTANCPEQVASLLLHPRSGTMLRDNLLERARARTIQELRVRGPCPGTNMKRRSRRSAVAHSVVRCILIAQRYSVLVAPIAP